MAKSISPKAALIAGLLDDIGSLDEMIALHHDDAFMQNQYRGRKAELIEELSDLMAEFSLSITPAAA